MSRKEMIKLLRDMQAQVIHGTNFFGEVADMLELDERSNLQSNSNGPWEDGMSGAAYEHEKKPGYHEMGH